VNCKHLAHAIATCGVLLLPESVIAAEGQQGPLEAMSPALRMPQTDEATARLVWQAVVNQFPEIVNGPERDGIFVIAIALRPDGSVVRSGLRYSERESDWYANQQALRELMPVDAGEISGLLANLGYQRKGAAVLDDRILKGRVVLNVQMVPANWDETRDSGLVQRAVIQRHANLFLPPSGDHINQLTVVMNEKGEIARERVEALTVEHQGAMATVLGQCRLPPRAGDFGEYRISVDEGVAVFGALGVGPDQVGMAGSMRLSVPISAAVAAQSPRPVIGADGIERGVVLDTPELEVCYAWPRRPGEPAGGTPLAWDSIPRPRNRTPPQMLQVYQLTEQYFPSGSPADGNWMLLTYDGKVLRTGHVELHRDEALTSTYVERMLPGIKVGSSEGWAHTVTPKNPGEMHDEIISGSVFFLQPGSPLPPPENVLPAK